VGNKIGKELLIEENIKLALKVTIKYYNTEVSKKIPAKILSCRCKDPVTEQLKFPSGEVTINTLLIISERA
jgi:hypothetical protein